MLKPDKIQTAKRVDEMARCARAMAETLEQFSREAGKANGELGLARSYLLQAARQLEMAYNVLNAADPSSDLQSPISYPLSDTNDPIHRRD